MDNITPEEAAEARRIHRLAASNDPAVLRQKALDHLRAFGLHHRAALEFLLPRVAEDGLKCEHRQNLANAIALCAGDAQILQSADDLILSVDANFTPLIPERLEAAIAPFVQSDDDAEGEA